MSKATRFYAGQGITIRTPSGAFVEVVMIAASLANRGRGLLFIEHESGDCEAVAVSRVTTSTPLGMTWMVERMEGRARHNYTAQHAAQSVAFTLSAWGYAAHHDGQFVITDAPAAMVRKAEAYNYVSNSLVYSPSEQDRYDHE